MKKITSSVGKGGINNSNDTKIVQELLNRATGKDKKLLNVDGIAGFYTNTAIGNFQQEALLLKSLIV